MKDRINPVNIIKRKKMVVAMEFIARQLNDEEVFESWLMCGVADGDIKRDSLDIGEVEDYYTEDEHFAELMEDFLSLMKNACYSGGLYCDEIVSTNKRGNDKTRKKEED